MEVAGPSSSQSSLGPLASRLANVGLDNLGRFETMADDPNIPMATIQEVLSDLKASRRQVEIVKGSLEDRVEIVEGLEDRFRRLLEQRRASTSMVASSKGHEQQETIGEKVGGVEDISKESEKDVDEDEEVKEVADEVDELESQSRASGVAEE